MLTDKPKLKKETESKTASIQGISIYVCTHGDTKSMKTCTAMTESNSGWKLPLQDLGQQGAVVGEQRYTIYFNCVGTLFIKLGTAYKTLYYSLYAWPYV